MDTISQINKYYQKGYLEVEQRKWRSQDRLRAAEILQRLFFKAGFTLKSIDFTQIRVDHFGYKVPPEARLIAEDKFRKAIRCVPKEFFFVINEVVIEDKPFPPHKGEELYSWKWRLCVGLDYLCDFFVKKDKTK